MSSIIFEALYEYLRDIDWCWAQSIYNTDNGHGRIDVEFRAPDWPYRYEKGYLACVEINLQVSSLTCRSCRLGVTLDGRTFHVGDPEAFPGILAFLEECRSLVDVKTLKPKYFEIGENIS